MILARRGLVVGAIALLTPCERPHGLRSFPLHEQVIELFKDSRPFETRLSESALNIPCSGEAARPPGSTCRSFRLSPRSLDGLSRIAVSARQPLEAGPSIDALWPLG